MAYEVKVSGVGSTGATFDVQRRLTLMDRWAHVLRRFGVSRLLVARAVTTAA